MSLATILIVIALLIFAFYMVFGGKSGSISIEKDAKRFAKLLISEIKLSEPYKVERGLKNNNLYESLKDEMETARKKYKKRIQNAEYEKHFEDCLVEILANGDKSKLGLISTSTK